MEYFRVNETESLFVSDAYKNLESYDIEETLCTCGDDPRRIEIWCDSSKVKVCSNSLYHISPLQDDKCPRIGMDNTPYSINGTSIGLYASSIASIGGETVNSHDGIYPKVISMS